MRGKDFKKLSKTLSHALRHEPDLYGLKLDEEGWAKLADVLHALKNTGRWNDIYAEDIIEMQQSAPKQRFELQDGKIRALYGHSLPEKIKKIPEDPPKFLYHGTPPDAAKLIMREGLRSMDRQYVHLSTDKETAIGVARRRTSKPVILQIEATTAARSGINFYRGNDSIWLADEIPPQFISVLKP